MEAGEHSIELTKVHFRTVLLRYTDANGIVEAYLEESAVPEYDWVGAEPDLGVEGERLQQILSRIEEWADDNNTRIKIWSESQLGILLNHCLLLAATSTGRRSWHILSNANV